MATHQTSAHVVSLVLAASVALAPACNGGDSNDPPDAGRPDGAVGGVDGGSPDAGTVDAGAADADVITYNCGAFDQAAGWTVATGFRAVVVADTADGLRDPVAATLGADGRVVLVNQGNSTLTATDPLTGSTQVLVAAAAWPTPPSLLTTIVRDAAGVFDGALYVGDQSGDGDSDSRIYRVNAAGAASLFVTAPGPGLDDIYGLAFAPPGSAYPAGLYVTGDTDGSGVDWGVYAASGDGVAFSEVAGCEGMTFDAAGVLGGGLFASCPAGGGYAGNDAINRIGSDGALGTPLLSGVPGVHAVTMAPSGGLFGNRAFAASWSTQKLIGIDAGGGVLELASGLALTNYDGNILAFSPDGRVLFVADRLADRLVCIEPTTGG